MANHFLTSSSSRPGRFQARALLATLAIAAGIAACTGNGGTQQVGFSVRLSGAVRDWKTGATVAGVTVRTVGVLPSDEDTSGSNGEYSLQVPINGYLLLELENAGYVTTLSPSILMAEDDITGADVEIIADADAGILRTGFGITDSSGHGHIIGTAQAPSGAGIPGVAAVQVLPVTFDFDGPYFFTPVGDPDPGLLATTSNGGFGFFNVTQGNVNIQATAAGLLFQPSTTVVRDLTWSLVVLPGDGPAIGGSPTPTATATGTPPAQFFAADIRPIFTARGCNGANACHKSGNPGGGFRMDQSAGQIYPAVFARTLPADPANSLILIKPLFEAVPNHTGGNIFANTADPDYQKMLRWITDGALNN